MKINQSLLRRIEALEREDAERCVLWIGPPEGGLDGWEIVPMASGAAEQVWREAGETDESLGARVAALANRHRGVVVAFGMDAQGVTR